MEQLKSYVELNICMFFKITFILKKLSLVQIQKDSDLFMTENVKWFFGRFVEKLSMCTLAASILYLCSLVHRRRRVFRRHCEPPIILKYISLKESLDSKILTRSNSNFPAV